MAKKIKKISIGGEAALEVYDVEAAHTINGYPNKDIENQAVVFANKAISTEEINGLFTAQASEEGGK
ncbi:hypothetical protein [Intestinibacter sp.]|uniref:hypothetical protein n=1 Tax=Intestinibacter sp. TaxID=1965304 RepID=UPI002A760E2F|nr:hypothetical protein [Intestinibacter sp.]MDY2737594.1 hypothetical protein [Intestinibacter sp.]